MRFSPPIIALGLAAAIGAYLYAARPREAVLPAGLLQSNGRIEVERVDVATRLAGRIAEIL